VYRKIENGSTITYKVLGPVNGWYKCVVDCKENVPYQSVYTKTSIGARVCINPDQVEENVSGDNSYPISVCCLSHSDNVSGFFYSNASNIMTMDSKIVKEPFVPYYLQSDVIYNSTFPRSGLRGDIGISFMPLYSSDEIEDTCTIIHFASDCVIELTSDKKIHINGLSVQEAYSPELIWGDGSPLKLIIRPFIGLVEYYGFNITGSIQTTPWNTTGNVYLGITSDGTNPFNGLVSVPLQK